VQIRGVVAADGEEQAAEHAEANAIQIEPPSRQVRQDKTERWKSSS
jgi:hypothetical protein